MLLTLRLKDSMCVCNTKLVFAYILGLLLAPVFYHKTGREMRKFYAEFHEGQLRCFGVFRCSSFLIFWNAFLFQWFGSAFRFSPILERVPFSIARVFL